LETLLIDDHPLVREILAATLRKALGEDTVVHTAADLEAALKCPAEGALDLVLLDLGLPGFTGIEALQCYRDKRPDEKVVVVSANDERESVEAALRAGAAGYIPKTSKPDVVIAALKLVAAGGTYLPLELLGKDAGAGGPDNLSERQHEVLGLLLKGQSNSEIARHLGMAENAVKHHLSAIYQSLGATTRGEAMIAATRRGYKPGR
jgi:DNA-binding NarL/FixJ family response regulator